MKLSNRWASSAGLLTLAFLAGAVGCSTKPPAAEHQREAQQKPAAAQRSFASPEEAAKALQAAAAAKDKTTLGEIFGPEFYDLLTGDPAQDAENEQSLAVHVAESCKLVKEGEDKITLEVGANAWPMPIPLVKADGQWHFDTAAGKEEIINRHIGKDELQAIGVCRAYVTAQRRYAAMNPAAPRYAQKFKSSPGMKDGLYWPATENEPASPFGPAVAEAHVEGFGSSMGAGSRPFHGYCFRILTCQGKDAPGGEMSYMSHGNLTGGFALVAYPRYWGESGIMTFIVNQDGKVYQRNLGATISRLAPAMKEYNPDSQWTPVEEEGIPVAPGGK
jgi:hypothetical protein